MEFFTNSPRETKKLARNLAKKTLKQPSQKGAVVVGLEGDLGGGKTTFLQGFAKGLGIRQRITSPTFVIMRRFKIYNSRFENFYHIDCYRIKKPKEILDLGWKEIVKDSKNIIAIEWADRIKKIVPVRSFWLKFEFISSNKRKITTK